MSQQYLMAIDAGTGSVRAVIFSLDGEQHRLCYSENGNTKKIHVILEVWILTGRTTGILQENVYRVF